MGSVPLKGILQAAALRGVMEGRRGARRCFQRRGVDCGAEVNVNAEGECPARTANHKRQRVSWAWAKDFMTLTYSEWISLGFFRDPPTCMSDQF